jgi:dihydroorotate dehydrogenase electron transfer subunit
MIRWKMENKIFAVKTNVRLAESVYKMTLEGDASAITAPGQFVNIELDGLYLRRPISVCDLGENELTIIYKVVGAGTQLMSGYCAGQRLSLLTGLGNGYDLTKCGNAPLLIGGGVGAPPLYLLAKRLIENGKTVKVILGFNTAREIFLKDELRALGAEVYITTADGSGGIRGFVTDALAELGEYGYTYACGPEPMLKAVYDRAGTDGQFSFEERMGCGFGACMGCSCKTKYGNKRICREGPVLEKGEIIW